MFKGKSLFLLNLIDLIFDIEKRDRPPIAVGADAVKIALKQAGEKL